MDAQQTYTFTISQTELREALKLRFPHIPMIMAMSETHGAVTMKLPDKGPLTLQIWRPVDTQQSFQLALSPGPPGAA